MKRSIVLALVLAGLTAAVVPAAAAPAELSSTHVFWHAQSGNPQGTPVGDGAEAQLVRNARGISYSLQTTGLRAGHAYTIWVVVINNPAACSASPCSPQDILLTPATNSTVTYGTGHVVGENGAAGFGGHLSAGPLTEGWIAGRGIDDPFAAEVHLVLNDHGDKLAEFMPEMIQTYRAGCTDASLPAIFPASAKADGTPGPNTCRLWQAAVFK
jgi:hypothetical protein